MIADIVWTIIVIITAVVVLVVIWIDHVANRRQRRLVAIRLAGYQALADAQNQRLAELDMRLAQVEARP